MVFEKSRCWVQVLLKLRNDVTDTMVESIVSSSERKEGGALYYINTLWARGSQGWDEVTIQGGIGLSTVVTAGTLFGDLLTGVSAADCWGLFWWLYK
jgi:hypothetical protein